MVRKGTISVYIPQDKKEENLVKRLEELAEERDRSVNYMVVQAVTEYLEREDESFTS